jgi:hypothetical protein
VAAGVRAVQCGIAACVALLLAVAQAAETVAAPQATDMGLPDGPGRAQTLAACGQCHAIGVVMARRLTPRQWEVQIEKMIAKGAIVRDEDFDAIRDYLAATAGMSVKLKSER